MRTIKVKIEFKIEAEEYDVQGVTDAIREELNEIIEDEDPMDRRGVSVDIGEDEDEE